MLEFMISPMESSATMPTRTPCPTDLSLVHYLVHLSHASKMGKAEAYRYIGGLRFAGIWGSNP